MRGTDEDRPLSAGAREPGAELPDLTDLDLLALSRESSHPVLAAVATGLLPRKLRGGPAMAFYEDGPYQL
ncbi:YxD-tail cyclophane-containing RiPP peptide [Streptomyces sp. NPDC001536]|uniref:YxD-tail cyclophane-containing RiPP peptide n=1 Tax=Streptomyces sp. NPDC001536 TaxID=3364583 RepID=UPI0036CDBFE4